MIKRRVNQIKLLMVDTSIQLMRLTRLGVDMVMPWNSVRIKFGLDLWGPDIRPDFDNRHLIIEGHRGLRRW